MRAHLRPEQPGRSRVQVPGPHPRRLRRPRQAANLVQRRAQGQSAGATMFSVALGLAVYFVVCRALRTSRARRALLAIFCTTVAGLVVKPAPVGMWCFMSLTFTVMTKTPRWKWTRVAHQPGHLAHRRGVVLRQGVHQDGLRGQARAVVRARLRQRHAEARVRVTDGGGGPVVGDAEHHGKSRRVPGRRQLPRRSNQDVPDVAAAAGR